MICTGFEPVSKDWKSSVLALRRTDQDALKKPGPLETGLAIWRILHQDPVWSKHGLGYGYRFLMQEAKRSSRKRSPSRNDIGDMVIWSCIKKQKTPQSLAGLMSYRYSLHLFNSKTCPAIGIIPIGTKPGLCLFMEYHVAHCYFFCSAKMAIIFWSYQIFAQLFFILYLNKRQTWESFFK